MAAGVSQLAPACFRVDDDRAVDSTVSDRACFAAPGAGRDGDEADTGALVTTGVETGTGFVRGGGTTFWTAACLPPAYACQASSRRLRSMFSAFNLSSSSFS